MIDPGPEQGADSPGAAGGSAEQAADGRKLGGEDVARFIAALFPRESNPWVTGFTESPAAPSLIKDKDEAAKLSARMWAGGPAFDANGELTRHARRLAADANQYVCISTFREAAAKERDGKTRTRARRRKAQFGQMHALMVDDIGPKVRQDKIKLPLTCEVETSPGNAQGWYALDPSDPDTRDAGLCAQLIAGMIARGLTKDLTDPGMSGVTRYGRLPAGVNNKPGRAPWRVRLLYIEPSRRYRLREIAAAYGITLEAKPSKKSASGAYPPSPSLVPRLAAAGLNPREKGDGWHDITCPWVDTHTDARDDGSAYAEPSEANNWQGGFVCHHNCKTKRNIGDLRGWLGAQEADAAAQALAASLLHAGEAKADAEEFAAITSREWTLEELRAELVMLQDGAQVAFLSRPYIALPYGQAKLLLAGSSDVVRTENSSRRIARLDQWNKGKHVEVWGRTHSPGGEAICLDPQGRRCLNLWRPQPHAAPDGWQEKARGFFEHVEFLVPLAPERERFLDWLAHIEQQPGVRPHTHYLMRTRKVQGVGRNWLAEVLARCWPADVARSIDIMAMLAGGFNGLVAGKLLGVVDELHIEQAGTSLRKLAQALKSELTATVRNVKPKYAREYVEFCLTRWLMFSNHVAALPVDAEDRRLVVIENPGPVRPSDYYVKLYRMRDDAAFIASVREALRRRDISCFNPGEHAPMSDAKRETVEATTGALDAAAREIVESWPSDLILSDDLRAALTEPGYSPPSGNTLRAVAMEAGMRSGGKQVKFGGHPHRYWVLRNWEAWAAASPHRVADELRRGRDGARDEESWNEVAARRVFAPVVTGERGAGAVAR
jgi:hypothetical protein